jgi:hypothetical protein
MAMNLRFARLFLKIMQMGGDNSKKRCKFAGNFITKG